MGLDLFLIEIAEQGLGSRTYAKTLLKLVKSAMGNPCNFRCKSFYVIFLFVQKGLWNKHWHIYILYACLFKSAVKLFLDVLPDCISCRFDCHTAFYTGIAAKLSFFYNVCIPLCKIHIHGSDGFYHFLLFCHDSFSFSKNCSVPSQLRRCEQLLFYIKKAPSSLYKGPKGFGGTTLISNRSTP